MRCLAGEARASWRTRYPLPQRLKHPRVGPRRPPNRGVVIRFCGAMNNPDDEADGSFLGVRVVGFVSACAAIGVLHLEHPRRIGEMWCASMASREPNPEN